MPFATNGLGEGVNLTTVYLAVSATTPEIPGTPMAVGTRVQTDLGGEAVLCQVAAGKACVAGDFVVVTNHATWQIDQLTNTTGRSFYGSRVGVVWGTGAATNLVWVQFSGYVASSNIVTASTAFTVLHSSATVGRATSTASGGVSVIINGAAAMAVAASNTAAVHLANATIGAND